MVKNSTAKNSSTKSAADHAEAGFAPSPQKPEQNSLQANDVVEDWGFLQMKTSNNAHVVMSA